VCVCVCVCVCVYVSVEREKERGEEERQRFSSFNSALLSHPGTAGRKSMLPLLPRDAGFIGDLDLANHTLLHKGVNSTPKKILILPLVEIPNILYNEP